MAWAVALWLGGLVGLVAWFDWMDRRPGLWSHHCPELRGAEVHFPHGAACAHCGQYEPDEYGC